MEENSKLLDTLFAKASDYGKTTLELYRLRTLNKTADIVSTIIPHSFVLILISIFLIVVNLGVAFWLGEILGKIYFGFFVVAGFYILAGLILHFGFHRRIKKGIRNYMIRQMFR